MKIFKSFWRDQNFWTQDIHNFPTCPAASENKHIACWQAGLWDVIGCSCFSADQWHRPPTETHSDCDAAAQPQFSHITSLTHQVLSASALPVHLSLLSSFTLNLCLLSLSLLLYYYIIVLYSTIYSQKDWGQLDFLLFERTEYFFA